MTVYSEFCLNPGNCYPIKTEIPAWVFLILIGSGFLIIDKIFNH